MVVEITTSPAGGTTAIATTTSPATTTTNNGPPKKLESFELDEISLDSRKRAATAASCQNPDSSITMRGVICVITLFFINLLNYMDRYTVAGVLSDIQTHFNIDDSMAGFLQTVFIIFYMVFAPICGYLGDRFNRKWIMVCGLSIWVSAVVGSSFVPADLFWLFLILRGVVGIGEASYAIIAPSIIGDLFTKTTRSRVLMIFYFAIPVGSGAGYIVGSAVSGALGDWTWGIRVTPIFGVLSIFALIFLIQEPVRGEAEKLAGATNAMDDKKTSYWEDIKYLCSVKTYLWGTLGYTSVVFVTGTLAWWAPTAIQHSLAEEKNLPYTGNLTSSEKNEVSVTFGGITCVGGIVGVAGGVIASQIWREGKFFCSRFQNQRADALICAIGSTVAIPFFFLGMHLITTSRLASWFLIFISICFLCLNWAVNVDMLLYIILPRKRNIANSWQITISHMFGDASGPYIIGLVSDWIRGSEDDPKAHFDALLKAFYIPNTILIISAVAFFIAATMVLKDKRNFELNMGYRKKSAKVGDVAMLNGYGSGLDGNVTKC
uniref:Major facilitator superfamily (MFS) profile domain-containing protein n=1 Tax=Panagrolaimus sp. PS1159 TaxID=55785 RepID=A0AC35FM89_9BILA